MSTGCSGHGETSGFGALTSGIGVIHLVWHLLFVKDSPFSIEIIILVIGLHFGQARISEDLTLFHP